MNCKGLKADEATLNQYLAQLNKDSPTASWT